MQRIASVLFRNVLLLVVGSVLLTACGGKQMSIEEFQNMAREAEENASTISSYQEEMRDIIQAYNQTVSQDRRLVLMIDPDSGLRDEELHKLASHIESESDESCRGVLMQIIELQGKIDGLHERLLEITANLPDPHRVKRGENHYTLCVDYLMKTHALPRKTADSLVARVALTGDIIEGFHVWFLYQDAMFGTFVTQGDAHISPTVFAKVVKNNLLEQARKQGRHEAFEIILDSLKRSGALLATFKKTATNR